MEIIKPENFVIPVPVAAAAKKEEPAPAPKKEEQYNVFVYGAGKMGHVVAAELAIHGYHVQIFDEVEYKLESATGRIYEKLQSCVTNELLNPVDIAAIMSRIHIAPSVSSAAAKADIVFECCVDVLSVKKKIFQSLDTLCPPYTVIATQSLNIPLKDIIGSARIKNRVVGTRFLYPVLFIPRVEITYPPGDPYAYGVKKMLSFLGTMGKKPFFFNGTQRELLTHDEVVSIYEELRYQFVKVGRPGSITRPSSLFPSSSESASAPPPSHSSHSSSYSRVVPPAPPAPVSSSSSSGHAYTAMHIITSSPSSSSASPPVVASPTTTTATTTTTTTLSSSPEKAESKQCVICMEQDRNCVLVPCGHICTCYECAVSIKGKDSACPICRVTIQTVVKTFVA